MKTLIFTLILLSSTAFATEEEGQDNCSALRSRRDSISREQSQINRDFFTNEEEGSWSSPSPEAFNCEDVPDSRAAYLKRYDALSKERDKLELEIERYCPRSYPE